MPGGWRIEIVLAGLGAAVPLAVVLHSPTGIGCASHVKVVDSHVKVDTLWRERCLVTSLGPRLIFTGWLEAYVQFPPCRVLGVVVSPKGVIRST